MSQSEDEPRVQAHFFLSPRLRLLLVGFLLLLVAAGVALRFVNLGGPSFWTDEMYHVVAARSLLETGKPIVPGWGEYRRAYPVTWITARCFSRFGQSETVARAPLALANILFLLVAFLLVRRYFGTPLAVLTLLALLFSPHEIRTARECRMYGLLQLLYFAASFLFLAGVERGRLGAGMDGPPGRSGEEGVGMRGILLLASAAALLLVAFGLQRLASEFVIGLGAYCGAMSGWIAVRSGPRAALASRYVRIIILTLAAAGIAAVIFPDKAGTMIETCRQRPAWDTRGDALGYYSWMFLYYYPGFTFAYLLGAVLLVRRFGRAGLFVVSSFLPLMIVHVTLFTGRVAERYVLHVLPFFFLTSCFVVETAGRAGLAYVIKAWREGSRAFAVLSFLAVLPILNLFASHWLASSRDLIGPGIGPNWKEAAPTLREMGEECVVLTTWPREVFYYGGRFPDYILTKGYEDRLLRKTGVDDHEVTIGEKTIPVRRVRTAGRLAEIIEGNSDVCVVATDWSYENPDFLDNEMRALIAERMSLFSHGGDERIRVFRKRR
ncbi:MAG: glycosyltransferase family 39 protein [Candidatus Eisenbacteria bacterium]